MVDTSQLNDLISALRAETEANSVSPERVGYVLQQIVDSIPKRDDVLAGLELKLDKSSVVQSLGNSTTLVLSQAAVNAKITAEAVAREAAQERLSAAIFSTETLERYSLQPSMYIAKGGNLVLGGAWNVVLYRVNAGDEINLVIAGNNASGGNSQIAAAWYSATDDLSSEVYIGAAIDNKAGSSDGTHRVTAPEGAVCLAVTLYKGNSTIPAPAATAEVVGLNVSRMAVVEAEIMAEAAAREAADAGLQSQMEGLLTSKRLSPLSTLSNKYIDVRGDLLDGGAYNVGIYGVTEGDVLELTFAGYSGIGSGVAYAARWYSATEDLSSENALARAIEGSAKDADGTHRVKAPEGAVCLAVTLYKNGTAEVVSESVSRLAVVEAEIARLDDRVSALEGGGGETLTGTLNVLAIGNSYSYDALTYLPSVLALAAPDLDVTVGIAMDGSQTLQGHYDKINSGGTYTRYSKLNIKENAEARPTRPDVWDVWSLQQDATIDTVLGDVAWDVILLHEASVDSAHFANVGTYLPQIITALRAKDYTGQFGYLITPAFAEGTTSKGVNKLAVASENAGLDHVMSSDEMSRRIVEVALRARKEIADIDVVLPCGIALQMARHTELQRLGDWAPEDGAGGMLMFSDGHHLQMGVANYVESCAAAIALTNGRLHLVPLTGQPHWANGDRMCMVNTVGSPTYTGLNEPSMRIAIECATMAAADLAVKLTYAHNNQPDNIVNDEQ